MSKSNDAAPVATVPAGQLKGYRDGDVLVFKGVPYGDTTAGENRFGPPRPVKSWAGLRDATAFGPAAPQIGMPANTLQLQTLLGWGDDTRQGEDCLVLNVWTPALRDGGARPVMVRFHGGGYSIGSGAWPQSDGASLARTGDVVVVTVNHRLGGLGFLYLAQIAGDRYGDRYADSGNAGMLDLIAALTWVRDNIANFGGDPGNVTIFGESGGGAKVSTLLAMPAAQGLFHRAIVQSGPSLKGQTPAAATASARKVLAALDVGEDELHKLHDLPLERFQISAAGGGGPVVDGRSLPASPGEALAAGASSEIPLLIGFNQTEGTLLGHLSELPAVAALDEAEIRARLAPMVKGDLDAVIAGYRRAYPQATPGDLMLYIESAVMFGAGSARMAELKGRGSTAPVFMYRLTWGGRALDGLLKAAHGLEVPFTMHNPQVATALSDSLGSQALVEAMSGAWLAFARSGNPNTPLLPDWAPYTPAHRATMIFDNDCKLVDDPFGEQAVWGELSQFEL